MAKKYILFGDEQNKEDVVEEKKEGTVMKFVKDHKKGFLIGVISVLTAAVAGVVIAVNGNSDDENEEGELFESEDIEDVDEE